MTNRGKRLLAGLLIGAAPGALLWVVGAVVGGEALLSFGVIGILVGFLGMVIGGAVARGSEPAGGGTSKATVGAMIGVVPGLAMIFFMTRLAMPLILIGGLIGALIGGRFGQGSPPRPVH